MLRDLQSPQLFEDERYRTKLVDVEIEWYLAMQFEKELLVVALMAVVRALLLKFQLTEMTTRCLSLCQQHSGICIFNA